MAVSTQRSLVSADDLPALSSRLAAEGKRTELVRGDLVVMAPAGGRHGHIAHRLSLFIGNHVLEGNLGGVTVAAEDRLPPKARPRQSVRAPDVAFVTADRHGRRTSLHPASLEMHPGPRGRGGVTQRFPRRRPGQGPVTGWRRARPSCGSYIHDSRSVTVHNQTGQPEELSETGVLSGAPALEPNSPLPSETCSHRYCERPHSSGPTLGMT